MLSTHLYFPEESQGNFPAGPNFHMSSDRFWLSVDHLTFTPVPPADRQLRVEKQQLLDNIPISLSWTLCLLLISKHAKECNDGNIPAKHLHVNIVIMSILE